jgi:ANTAR domain/GAF domain
MREAIDERPEGPDALAGLARQLIGEFSAVGAKLHDYTDVDEVLVDLAATCQRLLPHADHASTSRRARHRFVTIGATSDVPPRVDQIQYELGHGPCVDAILTDTLFNAGDLRIDPRWPEFGRRAAEETGILSMLSFRLFFEDTGSAELMAALNLYAAKPEAFDEVDETITGLVATHGALAISAAQQRRRADGMTAALQSNRDIGAALGVLMARLLVTREQAFDLMRIASQRTNRKLRDIAEEVLETGTLAFLDHAQQAGRPDQARGGG